MTDKTSLPLPGPSLASSPTVDTAEKIEPVIPISNLPTLKDIPDDIPDEYRFEIFRLRRQVASLSSDNRRANDKLTKAIEVLHGELRFWKLGIYERQWETLGQCMRRMRHLEVMVKALEGPGGIAEAQPKQRRR